MGCGMLIAPETNASTTERGRVPPHPPVRVHVLVRGQPVSRSNDTLRIGGRVAVQGARVRGQAEESLELQIDRVSTANNVNS